MLRNSFSFVRFGTLALAATLLSGCAGARIYSETRDKQGIAAQDAWKKVDLTGMVNTDRENLKKVLTAQLETQEKLATAIRNNKLRSIVEAKSVQSGLLGNISEELRKITGDPGSESKVSPEAIVAESRKKLETYLSTKDVVANNERTFRNVGLAIPDCASVQTGVRPDSIEKWIAKKDPEKDKNAIAAILVAVESLENDCKDSDTAYAAVFGSYLAKGSLVNALTQLQSDKKNLKDLKIAAAVLKKEYREALEAFNTAVKAAATSGAQIAATVPVPQTVSTSGAQVCADAPTGAGPAVAAAANAAKRLCHAIHALDKVDNAFAGEFISKQRVDAIDRFVQVVTQSELDGKIPDDASKASVAFILIPKLLDDARDSLSAAKKPLITPLAIRKNMDQLKLDAVTREIALLESRVNLSDAIVNALYEQSVSLWKATEALKSTGANDTVDMRKMLGLSVADAFANATPDQKESLYFAMVNYLDSLGRLSAARYKLEYQRIATFHEVSLAYAEVNLKQWNTLIGSTIDQVAESGAGGIKPESITALVNTLGLLWIGQGVNK